MAVRPILQIGEPRLKAQNKVIENSDKEKVDRIIQDLVDTMHANDLVGIAAPQIGENFTLFVTEPRETETRSADQADSLRIYKNPKVIFSSSEQVIIYEGCGCVPGIFGPVSRPKTITIEAFDGEDKKFQLKTDGILGRVIQHEYDHLSGVEFTEKITDYKKLVNLEFYLKTIKNSPEQINASIITFKEYLGVS